MTINEAIQRVDQLKVNTFSLADKLRWLSQLDGKIRREILDTHEDAPAEAFAGYDLQTPLEQELLIKGPHEEVYLHYLEAQIDYYNGEISRYTNSMAMFNTAYSDLMRSYNRTHLPKSRKRKFY